jgi:inner membrane protein
LAAGELLHRSLPDESDGERQQLRHRLLLVTCALASNFPDLDLVLTPLLPAPLGYLLHHRGHTHTLFYALPQALLLWAVILLAWPSARRLLKASGTARTGFVLALCAGFGLHLMMDYLNSYGLHPFHPFDSRWLYGDMVFILEPFFWIAFGIPMAMCVGRPALRVALVAMLVAVPLFFTTRGFLPWASFGILALAALALGAVQFRSGARGLAGLVLSAAAVIGFVALQAVASSQARQVVMRSAHEKDPASRFLDASLSSFPTNPACWAFVSVESNEDAGTYRLRRGIVSLFPRVMPVADCPPSLSEGAAQKQVTPALAVLEEEQGSLAMVRALKQENCHFEAWLRFARAPSVTREQASDVRFASSLRGNFTTMNFEEFKNQACSKAVPKWDFPRADLLTPAPRHETQAASGPAQGKTAERGR